MAGIQSSTATPTFTQIRSEFSLSQGGKDHNIRFKGETLYTSDKASSASIKAFFGFGTQLAGRETKREDGVKQIKQAIDREYGHGMADRVLKDIDETHGPSLSGGIKRSDLDLVGKTADKLALQDKFNAALDDPNIDGLKNRLNYDKMQDFFSAHFEVATHPQFWSTMEAKGNVENIGSALAMNVLNRIAENGTITQQDLSDLTKALKPYEEGSSMFETHYPAAPPLGGHLVGVADEPKLQELARVVFDRFLSPSAPMLVNMGSDQSNEIQASFTQPHTAGERITDLNAVLTKALGKNGNAESSFNTMLDAIGGIRSQQAKFDALSNDPIIQNSFSGTLKYDGLLSCCNRHFDALTDPQLWSTTAAKGNVENIGSALAMTVLSRVAQNGSIRQSDLDDLSKALMPYEQVPNPFGTAYPDAPPLGQHLVGQANEARLGELTQVVFERFLTPTSPMQVNTGSAEYQALAATFAQPLNSAADRISGMHTLLTSALATSSNGIPGPAVRVMMDSISA